MSEAVYVDFKGENPITKKALKNVILEGSFISAWYAVSVYIMKMDISPFHLALMKHRVSSSNTLSMAGRGLGKSFLLTSSYTLTLLLRDHEIAIAIVTRTQGQSKDFVYELKQRMEPGGIIAEIFGDLRDTSEWNKMQFNLKRESARLEKTLTATSVATPGRIVGKHYDVLIIDDIADTRNSAKREMREKMEDTLYNDIFPAMHPQSEYQYIHIVGTHYHPDDIYIRLESKTNFNTLKIPAMYTDKTGSLRCIWNNISEKAYKRIMELKDNNPLAFEQQYQQKVRKGDGGIFKPEWLQYFSKLVSDSSGVYAYIKSIEGIEQKRKLDLYAGVDLAITKNDNSDYFVFAVIGVDENKNIYLIDFDRGRYSFNQQLETLKRMGSKWDGLIRIGIESVAYQQALLQEASRTTDLPVIKLKTSSDKISRLNSFSALFENSKVFTYRHMRGAGDLESEFLEFPDGEHDDIPDAFCMAWEVQKKNVKKRLIIGPKF